jgi:acetyltransferase-like isoleucine patch superfamily enzyme
MMMFIVKLFHFVINYTIIRKIKRVMRLFYSRWIVLELKRSGKEVSIGRGLFLVGGKYIEIGDHSSIHANGILTAWNKYQDNRFTPQIKIGNNCSIGEYCHITAINSIVIGNNVLTGKRITITDNAHGLSNKELMDIPPINRPLYSKGAIIIDDNVWIGDGVCILPNVHIGYGAIIAANTVVSKDIPSYCVAGGNPARILKYLK